MKTLKFLALATATCGVILSVAPSLASSRVCVRDNTDKGFGPGYNGVDTTTTCGSLAEAACKQHSVVSKARWYIGLVCRNGGDHTKCKTTANVPVAVDRQEGHCIEVNYPKAWGVGGGFRYCQYQSSSGTGWYTVPSSSGKTQSDCDTDPI